MIGLGKFRQQVLKSASVALVSLCLSAAGAQAQVLPSPFVQVLAAEAAKDEAVAGFYRAQGYHPIWTGEDSAERRSALFSALSRAGEHALPVGRYDVATLTAQLAAAQTEGDRAGGNGADPRFSGLCP